MMLNQNNKKSSSILSEQQSHAVAGRPLISTVRVDAMALKNVCTRHALGVNPDRIDLGKCNFCGDCAAAFPFKISFLGDLAIATNVRDRLIVIEGDNYPIGIDAELVRDKIKNHTGDQITFYTTSGDAFFSNRYKNSLDVFGISLSDNISQCEGILIEGDLERISDEELMTLYSKLKDPKVIVVSGMTAITAMSSSSRHTEFFSNHAVDLYVPGDPANPETLAQGIRELIHS